MKTADEWSRLFYGLLNEGRIQVTQLRTQRPLDPSTALWLATVEKAVKEYREDRTKGKPA